MTIRPAVFSMLAVVGALSACVQPPVPAPTIQDACAAASARRPAFPPPR